MSTKKSTHWIFLRGLSREEGHWGSFIASFEKALSAKVHCLDLPGTGKHFQEDSPDQIKDMVNSLREKYPIDHKPFILGMSMGALIAAEWMVKNPDEFSGAVFVNTSFADFSPWHKRLRIPSLFQFVQIGSNFKNIERRENIIFSMTCNKKDLKNQTVSDWVKIQQQRPVSQRTILRQLYAAYTWRPLQKPMQPILVLSSRGDYLVDSICSEKISKVWKLPIRTHPAAGHDIFHDDPQWVIQQIDEWLQKN